MKKYIFILLLILCTNIVQSQYNYKPNQIGNTVQLTGEDYITGEDGVPRMSINVWGHVKYPGTYLVYDGIDILTCLSMAGGPMAGAKLSKVTVVSKDGSTITTNLEKYLEFNSGSKSQVFLKPHDTIHIEEKFTSKILSRSNVLNTFLQLTNLILISTNNK